MLWTADLLHWWMCARPLELRLIGALYPTELAEDYHRAGYDPSTVDLSAAACARILRANS